MQKKSEIDTLSALVDGEVDPQALLEALDLLDADPDRAQDAALYALIGDALRAPGDSTLGVQVSASVMAAIANEPVPTLKSPAGGNVLPWSTRRLARAMPRTWRTAASVVGGVAATLFVSTMVWNISPVGSDPQVASAFFEEPANQVRVVQMDSMPADMVDYLLAHRQNSAAGSMNAGSALIRANLGGESVAIDRRVPQSRGSDMEWVRLWDSKPVYVSPSRTER